jgi:hypothetical protein
LFQIDPQAFPLVIPQVTCQNAPEIKNYPTKLKLLGFYPSPELQVTAISVSGPPTWLAYTAQIQPIHPL